MNDLHDFPHSSLDDIHPHVQPFINPLLDESRAAHGGYLIALIEGGEHRSTAQRIFLTSLYIVVLLSTMWSHSHLCQPYCAWQSPPSKHYSASHLLGLRELMRLVR